MLISGACVQGISTRSVDDLVRAMGMSGVSKSQVSRLCEEIDGKLMAFLERPLEGDRPCLGIDATYLMASICSPPGFSCLRLSTALTTTE